MWEQQNTFDLIHSFHFGSALIAAAAHNAPHLWVYLMSCVFVKAIWALALQAWGQSCNGQGGGGSSPPPSWVRTDSTVLTHSLQLPTLPLPLSLSLSLLSLCFNFFFPFPLDDASLPLCITCMHTNLCVHMYPNRHVGVVSIITLYLTFSSANPSLHRSVSLVHLLKNEPLSPNLQRRCFSF